MATQVKFYSTSEFSSTQNAGGIYFVGGEKVGELYKGTQRFGAARVTSVADTTARDALTGMIRGDIAICAVGGTFVYDGANWKAIGPDTSALQTSWRADISTWTAGLVAGGTGSIVTGITQDADGKVTATAIEFPEITSPDDGHVSLAGTDVEISGWSDLVSAKDDLVSRVEALETWEGSVTGSTVVAGTKLTAETGTFKNLTVAETATFNATTVEASTLTVADEAQATFGNLTISAIADREALAKIAAIAEATSEASDDGLKVTAVTQSGSIKSIAVAVDGATTVDEFTSESTKVATAKGVVAYVANQIESLDNAMHFRGTASVVKADDGSVTVTGDNAADPKSGDIVVDATTGLEAIYNGTKWELIGDNAVYALNAYSKEGSAVMNGVTTVSGGLDALAGAVDTLNGADTVVGSVAKALKDAKDYTDTTIGALEGEATGKDAETNTSLTVKVESTDGEVDGVTVTLNKATAIAAADTASDANLATEKAVRDAITSAELVWLDASGAAIA